MRIKCYNCGSVMKITDTVNQGRGEKEIYANCTNPDCHCRSKFSVAHIEDITPPQQNLIQTVDRLLANLPNEDILYLIKKHSPQKDLFF